MILLYCGMAECVFCMIIDRRVDAHIIDETDEVISFLSLENHPLVVPKTHIPDIYTLDEESGSAIMAEVVKIANAVKDGLGCDGVYVTQANGQAAGQDVFHIHFHLYPRWAGSRMDERALAKEDLVGRIRGSLGTMS